MARRKGILSNGITVPVFARKVLTLSQHCFSRLFLHNFSNFIASVFSGNFISAFPSSAIELLQFSRYRDWAVAGRPRNLGSINNNNNIFSSPTLSDGNWCPIILCLRLISRCQSSGGVKLIIVLLMQSRYRVISPLTVALRRLNKRGSTAFTFKHYHLQEWM